MCAVGCSRPCANSVYSSFNSELEFRIEANRCLVPVFAAFCGRLQELAGEAGRSRSDAGLEIAAQPMNYTPWYCGQESTREGALHRRLRPAHQPSFAPPIGSPPTPASSTRGDTT